MESETAYSLLHIPNTASSDEILHAYRQESLKYHPRRFDPGEKFIEIHFKKLADAYETLIDPKKRKEYDTKLKLRELRKVKNPDCTRLFDPQQQHERQRRHSTYATPIVRPSSTGHHHPSVGARNLLSQSHPIVRAAAQPIPIQQPASLSSVSRVKPESEQRARRSSISGLAPIPKLTPLQPSIKTQPGVPLSSSFSSLRVSAVQPPTRVGSCVPAPETSGFKQSRSRLDESLLSMRLNQYHNPHGSQPQSSAGQKGRVNRQSIINELHHRARSNSTTSSSRVAYPNLSTSASSSTSSSLLPSSISPSSSLSSSFSKFGASPSSGAPLSRMNFPAAQDLSAHFSPPRLLASSHHSFRDPPNDHEYQPLTANSSSQSHAKRPPTHHRLSRGSSRPF
ncbi:hypothetical protein PCASD_04964 [Puccinia coronata f. sp. avenae]|uniref:J domain-containing protein n=1 Tax=Puccinia coronata f. sp. avenae TaxID=200324 RepID=A0A2N5VD25_9BASI|nr:hypothetical protein PCASD_04964 [Puccinia coronata f. sp. avenae]